MKKITSLIRIMMKMMRILIGRERGNRNGHRLQDPKRTIQTCTRKKSSKSRNKMK